MVHEAHVNWPIFYPKARINLADVPLPPQPSSPWRSTRSYGLPQGKVLVSAQFKSKREKSAQPGRPRDIRIRRRRHAVDFYIRRVQNHLVIKGSFETRTRLGLSLVTSSVQPRDLIRRHVPNCESGLRSGKSTRSYRQPRLRSQATRRCARQSIRLCCRAQILT
jgi:hypothetical protein